MMDLETNPPQPAHYSGRNKVPNVQQFLERLDRQKKERDAAIDEELKQSRAAGTAEDHVEKQRNRNQTRTVRDPVTGKDVEIEDANLDFKEVVENPVVRDPFPRPETFLQSC